MTNRAMSDSNVKWIGDIPNNWSVEPIGKLFTERNTKVSDLDFPPLSVTKKGIVPQLENAAKSKNHNDRKQVNSGDFVINSRSDRKMSSGLSSLDGSVSLINIVLTSKSVFPGYTKYLLKNYGFAEEFYRWGTGIVADLWSTRYERMKRILLPYPPYEEQQKIATFLDEKVSHIDNIIEDTKKSIENLKAYKQSLITETVTKGLDPNVEMKDSGIVYIGKIPKNWSLSKLGYLGNLQNGISKAGDFFGSGYPFVSYGDVYKNSQLPSNVSGLIESNSVERERYSVEYGDVFFTRTSETIEEVGFVSTCLKTIDNAVFAGFLIRFRPNDDQLEPSFSKYYFRSNLHRKYFVKEMNIVTRASLSQSLLKKLPVLLPSKEEQLEIAQFLFEKTTHITSIIDQKEQLVIELESYKKSLIYEYVTGKKEVI